MSNIATIEPRQPSVIEDMAHRFGMARSAFEATIRATCMPGQNVSNEQFAAFLLVAKQHNLNPVTKEIFAFPSRGGIVPIVSVDGWLKMINENPDFDGMEFRDTLDDKGNLVSVTCRMFRKSRSHPTEVTEYMAECRRATDVWKNWPARMLRHKATIQAARYAFGFAGIYEPDEAERMNESEQRDPTSTAYVPPKVALPDESVRLHDEAAEQYAESIAIIKEQIARHDQHGDPDALYTVAEVWRGLPSHAQDALWVAPTKYQKATGRESAFTTHERDVIKTKLPRDEA